MTRRRSAEPPFPFALRAARFTADGTDWAVLSYSPEGPPPASGAPLTKADREVLAALLAGRSNAAIARARGTTVRTVANQVASLLRRFHCGSRRELAAHFAARSASR